ncbi:MAG: aconitate hydratase AcnA [Verrucomicrobiota bacterium]|nr:aconitate hydratase AcnA [Verrucomicrobiota bacterium]
MSDLSTACVPFRDGYLYSLPALEKAGLGKISRLPVSMRIVLESVLRNCDGQRVREEDVKTLAAWNATKPEEVEIPFVVARIVLQDFTGVPLLVDLAAMREAVAKLGHDPALIEPLVPVDLVVDHSVQVDRSGTGTSFTENLKIEFERNRERYEFLKWGQQAFETFSVVPPAIGIVHQVNLEYLAKVVFSATVKGRKEYYPDSLVGTDSHTTMINGLGVVGWGVGGIEAEAGMLGQPVYFLTPEVIGVHLTGKLAEGVTATDLTLRVTELLRKEKVVGKFVEFFGPGASALNLADRATVANMAPEYGATMGFFPIDERTLDYLRQTGRTEEQISLVKDYYTAQGLFGIPLKGDVDYTKVVELDLATIVPCVSGPKRPQDRIDVPGLKKKFSALLSKELKDGGYGISDAEFDRKVTVNYASAAASPTAQQIGHGSVVIAAITSCTNTSNPSVMIAAGLLAKKAVEKGLRVNPTVKTSLAPGSRVVTEYFNETGLTPYLDKLGFNLVGYGCTTCIGNSGPLDPAIETALAQGNLVAASVLSGNRNFEARVHSAVKSNFLMSPPLVVAYALAGRVDIDLTSEPIGNGSDGHPVYLKDIWPSQDEIAATVARGLKPSMFISRYSDILDANPEWRTVEGGIGARFGWRDSSTYIQHPPYFDGFQMTPGTIKSLTNMRALALLGDSVTTDHISPAGSFKSDTPAGRYLLANGVTKEDFNSYGSRRGNDRVMTRGTFANVRIKNAMADGKEGGFTKLQPDGTLLAIYDACEVYKKRGDGLIIFGGADYGMGSSRDWAAKGTSLLGVKAVVASSFERIHRSNLVGMGVLPLQFHEGITWQTLGLDGSETFSFPTLGESLQPRQTIDLVVKKSDGSLRSVNLIVRIDTPIEIEYYRHGGILPYVLRCILNAAK